MEGLYFFELKAADGTALRGWSREPAEASPQLLHITRVDGSQVLAPMATLAYLETLLPDHPRVPKWAQDTRPE